MLLKKVICQLIVHTRSAEKETIEILKKIQKKRF